MMFGTRETFTYWRCPSCRALNLAKTPDDLGRHYPTGYYSLGAPPRPSRFRAARLAKRARTEVLLRLPARPVDVLADRSPDRIVPPLYRWLAGLGLSTQSSICDVGTGSGALLGFLADAGFRDLYGLDPYLSVPTRTTNEVRIDRKDVSELHGSWDLIMLSHVLEHLDDPLRDLNEARKRLSPRGRILLRVPIADSWAARAYGEHWAQIDAPRHLMVPTVESIRCLASRTGMSVQRIFWDSGRFQFWASEQYQQDIPLNDERSWSTNPEASIFVTAQMLAFDQRARALNGRGEGDSAGFVLSLT